MLRVLSDESDLKSTVMTTDFKRNSSDRTQRYDNHATERKYNTTTTRFSIVKVLLKTLLVHKTCLYILVYITYIFNRSLMKKALGRLLARKLCSWHIL